MDQRMMAKAESQAATAMQGADQGNERGDRGVQPHALKKHSLSIWKAAQVIKA